MDGKDAQDVSNLILEKLEKDDIDIQNCRGQSYDNASVMSGKYSGVQARIKEINDKAEYINCTNHSLNLAGKNAASVSVNSVTFFETVEQVYVFFTSSTHRWDVLTATINQSVKRINETRWSARFDAVKALKNKFLDILNVLEDLTSEKENTQTRSDAGILLTSLQTFQFISFLNFWSGILPEIEDTQKYLQTRGLDLHQCDTKLMALKNLLQERRSILVDEAISEAQEKCEELGISTEKRCRRKKRMAGEKARDEGLSLKDELRREMMMSIDRVIQEMSTRFEQAHSIAVKFDFLQPCNLLNEEYQCDVKEFEGDICVDEFISERGRLVAFMKAASGGRIGEEWESNGPLELLKFIVKLDLNTSVPNIAVLLRIMLTMAVSVAGCERSFSKLKLIKNYLRSTMSSLRLSNLAILSIEREVTDSIDFEDVITEFANRKSRKVKF